MNLLKPEEPPENAEKHTEETKVKPEKERDSESSQSDKDEGIGEDMEEYVDENGMRVRRVVTKTVTTTSIKTSSDDSEPKHLTLETLQKESDSEPAKHLTLEALQRESDSEPKIPILEALQKESDSKPKHLTLETVQNESDQAEGDKEENTEVREYVDKNGRRVRRIVKTITTTSTRISSKNGPSNVTTETKQIKSGGHDPEKILINFGGGMPRPSEEHTKLQIDTKPRAIQEKEVFHQFGSKAPATQESHAKVDIKGQPFQTQNINMFERKGHTTITTGTSAGDNPAATNTVYQRSVITKTIGGGDGGTTIIERSTKTSSHGGEDPIMVVKKEKSQINAPEWMVEQSSPEAKDKTAEMSDINIHLKYSSDYNQKKKDLEPSVNESRIQAEVANRDKPVISMLTLADVVKEIEKEDEKETKKTEEKPAPPQAAAEENEDEEEEEEDDDDDDSEVDEFEEEIVVVEVRRKPRYHKALVIPEPVKEKAGIPIEDLLELPSMEVAQESAPDETLIEEKVVAVERPPTGFLVPNIDELFRGD